MREVHPTDVLMDFNPTAFVSGYGRIAHQLDESVTQLICLTELSCSGIVKHYRD